ncbi:MAG: bifunctional oligoribonuclease/PAP phosphatase NrnA, partial [Armatimonadota bacterium]|nr:bifunctional oligoribonuclease/PAP phosphatase NrnA [Armatimonadota bacterium]
MTNTLQRIATTLAEARTILIICHISPDGDCLGSSLALAFALGRLGKEVSVGSPDGVPEIYRFLPGSERILRAEEWGARADGELDVAVMVECSTLDRAGGFKDFVLQARRVVNLDHHMTQPNYGDLLYWDPQVSALGEIVYDLIHLLGVEVDGAIATCLMTAIVTDTGAFRFPNVSPRTLRIAADLMERGVHPSEVVTQVYDSRSVGSARILGLALTNLKVSP